MMLEVTSIYVALEGGFWGLEDKAGNQYMPVNFPEQLKQKNKTFKVSFIPMEGMMSFAQWGTLIEITGFAY